MLSFEQIRERVLGYEIPLVVMLLTVLAVAFYLPIIGSGNALGIQDWDANFAWTEFTRLSVLRYHQFPFWDPYRCGGAAHFANPQIGVVSLTTIFALFFGTVSGIKFSVLFHGIFGALGCYLFARNERLSRISSLFAAIVFSFSGITASFLSTGMVVFIGIAYIPWIMVLWNYGQKKNIWIAFSALLFSAAIYADYHVPLIFLPFFIVYVLTQFLANRGFPFAKRIMVFCLVSGITLFPKLSLSLELLSVYPRSIIDGSGYHLFSIPYFLLSRNQYDLGRIPVSAYSYFIDENSLYVGMIPMALFLFFFISNFSGIRKQIPLLVGLTVTALFMLGATVWFGPYELLKRIPIFSAFRVAQRFRFDMILPFAIVAGLGLDRLLNTRIGRLNRAWLSFLILGVAAIDLLTFSPQLLRSSLSIRDTFPKERMMIFSQRASVTYPMSYIDGSPVSQEGPLRTHAPWSMEFPALRQNIGITRCYDATTGKKFANPSESRDYRGEWYTQNYTRAVALQNWTPNAVTLRISEPPIDAPMDFLVLNQNHYPGWFVETDQGITDAVDLNGLVAASISKNSRVVTFRFLPYREFITRMKLLYPQSNIR